MDIKRLWALCSHGSFSFGLPYNDPYRLCTSAIIRQICGEIVLIGDMRKAPDNLWYMSMNFVDSVWGAGWGKGIGAPLDIMRVAAIASKGFGSAAPSRFQREYSDLVDANPLLSRLFDSTELGASAITACAYSTHFRKMCTTPFPLKLPGGDTVVLSSIFDVFCGNFAGLWSKRFPSCQMLHALRSSLLPASMVVWYHLATTLGGLQAKVDCDYTNADKTTTRRISSSNRTQFLRIVAKFVPGAYALRSTVAACVNRNSTLPTLPEEMWDFIFDCCTPQTDATGPAAHPNPRFNDVVRFCIKNNVHRALELDFPACMRVNMEACLKLNPKKCMEIDPFASLSANLDICCKNDPYQSHKWLTNTCDRTCAGCPAPTFDEITLYEGLLPEVANRCMIILAAHRKERDLYVIRNLGDQLM